MARPGLHNHPKFRRLVHLLAMPVAHVRGYLECLWDVAYENGNAVLGDETDVELAAQWVGEPGKLCSALLNCGGQGRTGFVELLSANGNANGNQIAVHDLFDHAPEYVFSRSKRESERQKTKVCDNCQTSYRSKFPASRFCSDVCRAAHWRTEHERPQTGPNGTNASVRQSNVQNGTPAPAPAPAPNTKKETDTAAAAAARQEANGSHAQAADPELRDWLFWWNSLTSSKLVPAGVNEDEPSQGVLKGWNRVRQKSQKGKRLRELLADRDAIEQEIRVSPFCRESWFRLEKLFGGTNRDGELILEKLLQGGYRERSGRSAGDPRGNLATVQQYMEDHNGDE